MYFWLNLKDSPEHLPSLSPKCPNSIPQNVPKAASDISINRSIGWLLVGFYIRGSHPPVTGH